MAEYIEREATIELLRSLGSRDYRREKGTIQEAIKMVSFSEYTPPPMLRRCVMGGGLTHTQTLSQIQCLCMESVQNADLNKEFLNI